MSTLVAPSNVAVGARSGQFRFASEAVDTAQVKGHQIRTWTTAEASRGGPAEVVERTSGPFRQGGEQVAVPRWVCGRSGPATKGPEWLRFQGSRRGRPSVIRMRSAFGTVTGEVADALRGGVRVKRSGERVGEEGPNVGCGAGAPGRPADRGQWRGSCAAGSCRGEPPSSG